MAKIVKPHRPRNGRRPEDRVAGLAAALVTVRKEPDAFLHALRFASTAGVAPAIDNVRGAERGAQNPVNASVLCQRLPAR